MLKKVFLKRLFAKNINTIFVCISFNSELNEDYIDATLIIKAV